jgi:transcription initiation factor IIE alpha subunit
MSEPFTCPKCKGVLPAKKSVEDHVGTTCDHCGAVITEVDVRNYLEKAMGEIGRGLRDLFG